MPKFAMYHWIDKPPAQMPKGYCQFSLKSPSGGAGFRPFNLFKWLEEVFILPPSVNASLYQDKTRAVFSFISMRTDQHLVIQFEENCMCFIDEFLNFMKSVLFIGCSP